MTSRMSAAEYHYTIPAIPPSNNKYIGRNARWEYQEFKKLWCGYVGAYCRPKPGKPLQTATVKLTYYFRDKRRRDPDNYSGLGLHYFRLELCGDFDRDQPRTEISVVAVESD